MKTAYIVQGYRTAIGKSKKGAFRFKRADELAAETIEYLMEKLPDFDKTRIDDVIVGNAMPEGSQGLNMARLISLMGLKIDDVPGVTVNRFCSSGLETIGMAVAKIQSGMAECIIAGGAESMSSVPMTGFKPELNYDVVADGHADYYWGMGNTAEAVAEKYNISRKDQDEFALNSHLKALRAQAENRFQDQIVPIEVEETYVDENGKKATRKYTVTKDEGPRKGSNIAGLERLRPVFATNGSVTAGNSSQTSDGAAFVMVMSEDMVKELNIKPIARMVSYAAAGVPPRIMGIGPVAAIPKALKQAGLKQEDISLIELNEAFASQSLAVIRELGLDADIINVNGGAIALGHPLGCTGAKLSVQLFDEMRKRNMQGKYGMVTMCVGTGQGAAGIFEFLN
ncbi:acetyl-CoA C-acyltransferase [Tenacibaculum finnmarkense genomovar finnmarkense]|uniref:acetyl-CoA C-acyltransferase n=1 Tax=Tenacibaculum finnmarkense TaxID=2781243 RepID=UPI000C49BD6B|nr:acetyl-CoA C-acyltransferase [Tenacibaculum finnmarkense]MBE7659275.1 acetyl-CoA C-acyltransferase [Tenacibaculum finnmarkense genomovar finnmarkense]MBE7691510.1 acetyl-CoA C-acyltransferase [Tenacibaculum finnmarkense genomovar finnmarkense]MCD8401994.1 acetyl-CoA C-acyltransferase [Tenacibaculum finnmarkense genomovar finnmarkense]MCD8418490.1 acetyl-CoA C-acyltransferase [Tenacibaculum finnmarkense genomovar finnmarkense]MCD8439385.1 acetyl-CoA C-acyltransferase [Tenacibaculum finnmarke